jgi:hypothetical protein
LSVFPSPYFVATPEGFDSTATPVNLNANDKYYGVYLTDKFDVIDALSVTLTGHYSIVKVDLADRNGDGLRFRSSRADPCAVEGVWRITRAEQECVLQ